MLWATLSSVHNNLQWMKVLSRWRERNSGEKWYLAQNRRICPTCSTFLKCNVRTFKTCIEILKSPTTLPRKKMYDSRLRSNKSRLNSIRETKNSKNWRCVCSKRWVHLMLVITCKECPPKVTLKALLSLNSRRTIVTSNKKCKIKTELSSNLKETSSYQSNRRSKLNWLSILMNVLD